MHAHIHVFPVHVIDISLIKSCKNTSQLKLVAKIAEVDCCFTGMSLTLSGSCFYLIHTTESFIGNHWKWDDAILYVHIQIICQ